MRPHWAPWARPLWTSRGLHLRALQRARTATRCACMCKARATTAQINLLPLKQPLLDSAVCSDLCTINFFDELFLRITCTSRTGRVTAVVWVRRMFHKWTLAATVSGLTPYTVYCAAVMATAVGQIGNSSGQYGPSICAITLQSGMIPIAHVNFYTNILYTCTVYIQRKWKKL